MRDIYENAVDSLRVGMKFFLSDKKYSSRKHSILTIFHSIELFLKEYLYRENPILIYKNIDKKINEDSFTVGFPELLIRLENMKLEIPRDQKEIIQKIQKRRNRIEHHRYDKKDEDEKIIAESLKFILYFVELYLDEKLEEDIEPETLREIRRLVFNYMEFYSLANFRLQNWMQEKWPEWNPKETDEPKEFSGTYDCPECREAYLVVDGVETSICFWCNTKMKVTECEVCGIIFDSLEDHECYGDIT